MHASSRFARTRARCAPGSKLSRQQTRSLQICDDSRRFCEGNAADSARRFADAVAVARLQPQRRCSVPSIPAGTASRAALRRRMEERRAARARRRRSGAAADDTLCFALRHARLFATRDRRRSRFADAKLSCGVPSPRQPRSAATKCCDSRSRRSHSRRSRRAPMRSSPAAAAWCSRSRSGARSTTTSRTPR